MAAKPDRKLDVAEQAWPADEVKRRAVKDLVPYARNARLHSAAQIDQIAASIREWGWTNPVLVAEDGSIIAGHGRVLAALKLGIAEVPVMVARGWTEAQKRSYILADNQLTLNASWDPDLLKVELAMQRFEFSRGSRLGQWPSPSSPWRPCVWPI
jgi:ParB-like chromosome segregation protein Spo0J